jgi:capsid protein
MIKRLTDTISALSDRAVAGARLAQAHAAAAEAKARAAAAQADTQAAALGAAREQIKRVEAMSMGDYKSARRTRIRGGTSRPTGGSDNWHADPLTRDNVRRDARSLSRNNPDARCIAKRIADLLVGDGLVVRSTCENPDMAKRYTAWFARWAGSLGADRMGRRTFWQMLHAIAQVPLFQGDGLWLKLRTGELQWIEGERIVNKDNALIDRGDMVGGVELDRGRIVRYHVAQWANATAGTGAYATSTTTPIDARNAIFVANLADDGLNQVRSVAALHAGIETLCLIEEMEYNASVAGAMAAIFGLIIKSEQPAATQQAMEAATEQDEDDATRPNQIALRPGMVQHLGLGESVEQVKAEQPNLNVPEFTTRLAEKVAADVGIAQAFSHLNMKGMTASNARALLAIQGSVLALAFSQIESIIGQVWTWRIGKAIEDGELPYAADFDRVNVVPRAMPQVDMNADIDASVKLMDNNLSSAQRETERLGTGDHAAILTERGQEVKAEQAAGVGRVLKPGAATATANDTPPQ